MEICYLNKGQLKNLNLRQNVLIRTAIGLSKFSHLSPLYDALNVMEIENVYLQHKVFFMHQIKLNEATKHVFEYLLSYNEIFNLGNESFISAMKKIAEIVNETLLNFNKNSGAKVLMLTLSMIILVSLTR